jgi:hypothetical protein
MVIPSVSGSTGPKTVIAFPLNLLIETKSTCARYLSLIAHEAAFCVVPLAESDRLAARIVTN